ncbi:MAG: leucine-rich repeat protein [Hominisplanchenecus sp.]
MKRKTWKKVLASFLAVACLPLSSLAVPVQGQAADGAQVSVVSSGDKITIGNDYISREFSVAGDRLSTTKITNKRTDGGDTVFAPAAGSEEFKIRMTKGSEPAIDRSGWTATADSYQNATGPADGNAPNLIDGNIGSIWHSNYGGGTGSQDFPYNVIFSLGKSTTFQCFSYTPRQEREDMNGNLKDYELYYSTSASALAADSSEWQLLKQGTFTYDGTNPIYVNLDTPCTATQLKLKAISAKNGQRFGGGAEFNLHEQKVVANTEEPDREFASSELKLKGKPVVEDTTATINNVEKTGKKITFTFEPYTFREIEYTISEVIVMYNGDHFMRKYMEISVPEDKKADAVIDYIDLESLKVNSTDATWTIPTNAGGIVQMNQFKANLGQPIYIQGMFFGCEFPVADNEIVDETGYMRYYTGKSFERLELDNQLTKDGKYMTWQTVAGAARSTDNAVIQADFFEYIKSIATPSEFRIQYNSWFDNMMLINDQNILESFIEIDRELNQAEVRPLDSYVVDDGWVNYNNDRVLDEGRAGTTLNQSGFWEFNSKFPQGLTPSSELVHNFGSNFGVWVGPRGGYNFYGSLADILVKSGKGSKAGYSIDVADRTYVKNFTEMAVKWMKDYGVNYWKWDGFADQAQYGAFGAADGVPGYANRHMTGGYEHMYHVTDLWEAWIDLMEAVRQCEKEEGINKLWISLTCYVNPSPWYLQWANSVWIQCTHDQNDAGSSSSKMDRQITYRDAAYYDFLKNHEFQFPLSNIYNHDPVYGKEGTGMTKDTATDEQFKNYLYMLATRGTAFWELYYSDSIMTDGKYEVTGEFLAWAEENYHMLKNSKMFGESPNTGTVLGGSQNGTQNAYGYSCFDGTDGIISVRNSATTAKSVTITFDRTIGVPESAGTLKYHIEHSHNLTAGTPATGEMTYGQEYTFTLQPDEVRILRVSKDGDTTAPEIVRAYSDGANGITVKFNEKVNAEGFKVNGTAANVSASADKLTFHLTAAAGTMTDGSNVTVTAEGVRDLAGNALAENQASFVYHAGNVTAESRGLVKGSSVVKKADQSLTGNGGFSVTAEVYTIFTGSVLAQGKEYEIGIGEDGKAYFTLNGATAVSKTKVNDGAGHIITGVKENNGILKIYVDGTLEGSGYRKENRYYEVQPADLVVGNDGFTGVVVAKVKDAATGYNGVTGDLAGTGEDGKANYASVDAAAATVEGLRKSDYKDFTAVEEAVKAVVRGKDQAAQTEVNAMAAAIFDAISRLETTTLKKLTDAVEKAKAEKLEGYTQASIAVYNKIIAEAEKVMKDGTATEAAQAEALAKVEAAKSVLVPGTDQPEKPEENPKQEPDKNNEKPAQPAPGTVVKDGQTFDAGNYSYKVTSAAKQTAEVTGVKNAKLTKITVYNTVTLGGKAFQITAVGASAFKNNKKVTSVSIGKNVEKLGSNAFAGCANLKTVTIKSAKLKEIGSKAFYNCKKLKTITIKSKQLKKAGKNAFRGIYKKAVIKVPASKYKAYTKLLAKKGQSKTVKIKK